jgi:hypothetical protein
MARYARDLVARYPKDSLAHLAMSEAYVQVAKNAWRYHDANPEQALQQALESAERAVALDPETRGLKRSLPTAEGGWEKKAYDTPMSFV